MCSESWAVWVERKLGFALWRVRIEKDDKLHSKLSFRLYLAFARAITLQTCLKRLLLLAVGVESDEGLSDEQVYVELFLLLLATEQSSSDASSLSCLIAKEKFDQIFQEQGITLEKHKVHFHRFCQMRTALEHAVQQAITHSQIPYSTQNTEHEQMLQRLWNALKPQQSLSARVSDDWKELGFQGRDPATDFRGMGILGLRQLLAFCESAQGKSIFLSLVSSNSNESAHLNFPFAIAGINITSSILGLRRPTLFKQYLLMAAGGATENAEFFQALYCKVFGLFWEHWEQSERNYMHFNRILAETLDTL